jgi:hypothetical protein
MRGMGGRMERAGRRGIETDFLFVDDFDFSCLFSLTSAGATACI